ncbi:cytochrome c oxidase assembly protein [Streptomyces sp. NPDC005876]|uniref:cytochrome c oxidase assembly protein n=1 Tax=Streptomyces sp. NPDC005876 TaxID=3157076 RepID=UPI00340A341F
MGGTERHQHHGGGGGGLPLEWVVPVVLLLVLGGVYGVAVWRVRRARGGQGWSGGRAVFFGIGVGLLAVAVLPPVGTMAHEDFRAHMAQHMLIGMYAPLALVLGAPGTLLLRVLPVRRGRQVSAVLRSRPVNLVAHPAVALLLGTGSLGVLYFTPLYDALSARPAGHWLMSVHFLASGCLFAHAIAGPDPAPGRPGVPARLGYLGVAVAAHALIAQAMYGGFLVHLHVPVAEVRAGAEIMYYAGDIAELLLAGALVATWRPERRRRGTPGSGPGPAPVTA